MRKILITGAASGIGAATARRLAGAETMLALHTRANREGLEKVAEAARKKGAVVSCHLADLADESACGKLINEAVAGLGGLDVLIANAGFADITPLEGLEGEVLERSFAAMPRSFALLCRSARGHLAQSGSGRILALSSFVAHAFRLSGQHLPASAAAKAALEGLVKSFAVELAPERITVNAVVPGFVEKDAGAHRAISADGFARAKSEIPLGRLGQPEDIAAAIEFLAGADAGYITGQKLHVDGGFTL